MIHRRTLCALACLFLLTDRLVAQPEVEAKDGRVTYSLTLQPSDYLRPASRTNLLPEYRESIQGNRVQMFLRCFMEQDNFFGREESERRQKWNSMPLKDLPLAELRKYGGGNLIDRDMYDAARMTNVDWQLWYFVRRDGFMTLLPDVQKMRALADALKTRARGQIAAKNYSGALHTLKTLFGLAKTMESHPTLIGQLVGVAIATIGINAIEELIQQPGNPNLFWALSDLPTPFISMRLGLEGERLFISHDFEAFKTAEHPLSEAVVLKKIESYEVLFKMEAKSNNVLREIGTSPLESIRKRAADTAEVKAARARLIQYGLKPEHVKVWTPLHVILLDDIRLYEQFRDELGKWLNLPYWQAKPGIDAAEIEFKKAAPKSPFVSLTPSVAKVKQAETRLDQRVAYVRLMEAIRLHTLHNGGVLPATLAEIKLPLPVDPVTGKPFEYSVKDGVATLHGANPNPENEKTNRYYEIRLQK